MNKDTASRAFIVTLLSAVLLAYQITLLQLLSYMQWYQFALLIISIAMLGYGAAGTLLALFQKRLLEHQSRVIPSLLFLTSLSMLLSIPLIQTKLFTFDSLLMFTHWSHPVRFLGTALVLMLPFLSGALLTAVYLVTDTENSHWIYSWIMVGSGAGGLISIALTSLLFPQEAVALLAGSLFLLHSLFTHHKFTGTVGAIAAVALFLFAREPVSSQFKGISKLLTLPGARVTANIPTANGLYHEISAPALRSAPCHSLKFSGTIPVYPIHCINGEPAGPVIVSGDLTLGRVYQFSPEEAPYRIVNPSRALILNSSESAVHAVANSVSSIDLVEPNSAVAKSYQRTFVDEPRVTVHQSGKRSFLHNSNRKYDLILLPSPNSFGGVTSLYTLNENPLLTVEAFREYREHLSDSGIIAVSWWHDYPPKAGLRFLSLAQHSLQNNKKGESHIRLIQNWGATTCIITNRPFTQTQDEQLRRFCREFRFDLLPSTDYDDLIHKGDSLRYAGMISLLKGEEFFIEEYTYNLHAPSDNRPFFSFYLRLFPIRFFREHLSMPNVHLRDQGYLVSVAAVTILGGAATILILLPLQRLKSRGSLSTVLYFGILGTGYMFAELVLIHLFSTYLSSPIYAISLVITSLLIGSGMGSTLLGAKGKLITKIPAVIAVILICYTIFAGSFIAATIGAPLPVRALIVCMSSFLPGFFMGAPFPLGLKQLNRTAPDQVPWAIGINSCFSVFSASLATLLTVEMGFSGLLALAALLYGSVIFIRLRAK